MEVFIRIGRPDTEYVEVMGCKVDKKLLELMRKR